MTENLQNHLLFDFWFFNLFWLYLYRQWKKDWTLNPKLWGQNYEVYSNMRTLFFPSNPKGWISTKRNSWVGQVLGFGGLELLSPLTKTLTGTGSNFWNRFQNPTQNRNYEKRGLELGGLTRGKPVVNWQIQSGWPGTGPGRVWFS